jgi:hypothetical protein
MTPPDDKSSDAQDPVGPEPGARDPHDASISRSAASVPETGRALSPVSGRTATTDRVPGLREGPTDTAQPKPGGSVEAKAPQEETSLVPLTEPLPHPLNPRRISDEQPTSLRSALEYDPEMLIGRPLIPLADGAVIAGNQRLRAAHELGWAEIPVRFVDLDEEQA